MKSAFTKHILLCAFLLTASFAFGTHLRSGEILVRHLTGNQYKITLKVYTRYIGPGSVFFSQGGVGSLNFGDGSAVHHPTEQVGMPVPMFPDDYRYVEYSVEHTYTNGAYSISYAEPNYSDGILNFSSSITTPFSMRTVLYVSSSSPYNTPSFPAPSSFSFPANHPLTISVASSDASSKTFYSLVTPPGVNDFSYPEELSLNPYTGIIAWTGKFKSQFPSGVFIFCVRVTTYTEDDTIAGYCDRLISVTLEDMQSVIEATNPVTAENARLVVTQGQTKSVKLLLKDEGVTTEAWQLDMDSVLIDNVHLTEYDSTSGDQKIRVGVLSFNTTAGIVRDRHYLISMKGYTFNSSTHEKAGADANILYFTKDVSIEEEPNVVLGSKENKITFNAYPIPCQSWLYLDDVKTGATLSFTDAQGRIALDAVKEESQPVNLATLPAGFYILEVRDGAGWARVKVLIR